MSCDECQEIKECIVTIKDMKEINDMYLKRESEILKRFDEVRPTKTFLSEAIEVIDMEFGGDIISDMIIEGLIKNEQ